MKDADLQFEIQYITHISAGNFIHLTTPMILYEYSKKE